MTGKQLSARERRFLDEYLVDLNATQAAIRAGYSARSAKVLGHRVLHRPHVAAAVEAATAVRSSARGVDQERIVEELVRIGFANMADYVVPQADGTAYVDLSRLNRDQAAAITEITVEEYTRGRGELAREVRRVKVKLADKLSALDKLMKHLGGYAAERFEHTGKDGGPIETRDAGELTAVERAHRIAALFDAARARGTGPTADPGDAPMDPPAGTAD
jgi:phage terminase small subunit